MTNSAAFRECVACLLIADGQLLVERRLLTKVLAPGAVAVAEYRRVYGSTD